MDESTFRGRINRVLSYLKSNFPQQQIILLTPIHRAQARFSADNIQPEEAFPNRLGLYIDDYVEVIIEDEGNGFDYIMAMIGLTESQENIYKDSGRGIFLISLYSDDFYFENNGSKIVMIKYIK